MISIIIPTYNESENISRLIDEIRKHSKAGIIVVDDNSPDNTAEIAKKKRVNIIKNKSKSGLGHAYIKGMEYAIANGSDILVEMDADFSHDPRYLRIFEKEIQKNDMVIGSRYVPGGSIPKEWAFHRKLISKYGNMILSYLLGNISDYSTGYRIIRKDVFEKVKPKIKNYNGYTFQVAFLNEARKAGFRIKEVPIEFKDRKYGQSKMRVESIINTLKYLVFDSWKNNINN